MQYLNPAAFQLVPLSAVSRQTLRAGNVAVGQFRAPSFKNLDISLSKAIPLGSSRRLELRADVLNALNWVNYASVQTNLTASDFGKNQRHRPGSRGPGAGPLCVLRLFESDGWVARLTRPVGHDALLRSLTMGTKTIAMVCALLVSSAAGADPLTCNLSGYKAMAGLTASVADNTLTVTWDGDNGTELRMRFGIEARRADRFASSRSGRTAANGATLATNVTPEFRVVSGMRRITQQQLRPDSIQALGGKVSAKVLELYEKDEALGRSGGEEGQIKESDVERWKWEAFWDAPLYLEGSGVRPPTHATSIPPMNGIFNQKGLPRTPDEVIRASATYKVQDCDGEDQRRAARDHLSRGDARCVRRAAAVRRVQGIEPDPAGRDRQDRAGLGGLQVRRRPQGAADSAGRRASSGATWPAAGRSSALAGRSTRTRRRCGAATA